MVGNRPFNETTISQDGAIGAHRFRVIEICHADARISADMTPS